MRNRLFVMPIMVALSTIGVSAQSHNDLSEPATFNNVSSSKLLPEGLQKLVPTGLQEKVTRWAYTDSKKRQLKGWYANGQTAVLFSYRGGHLNGAWQTWYENGKQKEAGHFKKGYPDGSWQFWYASGMLKSTRSFSAAKMQSLAIANRQRNPKLQFVPVSGNEPSSKETASVHPGITEAMHGLLHVDLPFRKAVSEGDFVNYAEDGRTLEQGKFVNGLRDGQWLYQNQNDRKIITGYYSNGLKHGPWKEMQGDTLLSLSEYKDGKIIFQKQYPEPGKKGLK